MMVFWRMLELSAAPTQPPRSACFLSAAAFGREITRDGVSSSPGSLR